MRLLLSFLTAKTQSAVDRSSSNASIGLLPPNCFSRIARLSPRMSVAETSVSWSSLWIAARICISRAPAWVINSITSFCAVVRLRYTLCALGLIDRRWLWCLSRTSSFHCSLCFTLKMTSLKGHPVEHVLVFNVFALN